jgi:hypothetical protein
MKTKPDDKLYCGVNEEKIKTSNPVLSEEVLGYHHNYVFERHKIYKRKEIEKLPQDKWTDDEVFRDYRFTNVRRELDRESVWLIEEISKNPKFSLKEKVLWSILFRTFNKSSTFKKLNLPGDFKIIEMTKDDIEVFRKIINEEIEKDPKYIWFTPAFNTGGLKYANAFPERITERVYLNQPKLEITLIHPDGTEEVGVNYKVGRDLCAKGEGYKLKGWEENIPLRMLWLILHVKNSDIVDKIINAKDQLESFENLLSIHGLAKFLAYQIFVDLTYIEEFRFSENEFTISGPGCDRGLDLLFEDYDGLSHEDALFWVRDNIVNEWEKRGLETDLESLFDHLPVYDRCLNVMMLENSFCELSKYTKAKRGTGRPRNRYVPTEEPMVCNECSLENW